MLNPKKHSGFLRNHIPPKSHRPKFSALKLTCPPITTPLNLPSMKYSLYRISPDGVEGLGFDMILVPNNHILTQNLYYNYYYPKLKYPILALGWRETLNPRP